MRLKLASRSSDLARIQAYAVAQALQNAIPDLQIDFLFRESLGDLNQQNPLWQMPEKGVFTEDFYQGLLSGESDLVVHSWKDLPLEEREGTEVTACLPRADQRDLLLFKKNRLKDLAEQKKIQILTSSPRRGYQLQVFLREHLPFQPTNLEFIPVRGNIPTRLKKLAENLEVQGLVVAKAAMDRILGTTSSEFADLRKTISKLMSEFQWMVLPLTECPTAAAQGAIAIEINKSRSDLKELFKRINCEKTFVNVQKERKILAGYGGGCHQKIGVSLLNLDAGKLTIAKGVSPKGEQIQIFELARTSEKKFSLPKSTEKIWPKSNTNNRNNFKRQFLSVQKPVDKAFFVSKEEALPKDWSMDSNNDILWAAGLETWKKLAARGCWVNGSTESLGEHVPQVEYLCSKSWVKLSHSQAPQDSALINLATYNLQTETLPAPTQQELRQATHFFWHSGSQFLQACHEVPEILQGIHFCGPGNSYKIISAKTSQVFVMLNYQQWLEEMSKCNAS